MLLKNLRLDHVAWLNAKLALFFWGVLYLCYTPEGPLEEIGRTLNILIALFAIFGSVISSVGLVLSTRNVVEQRRQGLLLEVFGLIIACCAPLCYSVIQLSLIDESSNRIPLAMFAYALFSFMLGRLLVVRRSLRRL